MTKTDQLSAKEETFLFAYIETGNITLSAKTAEIGDKTARRLVKTDTFQRALRAARKELFDQALDELRKDVSTAIGTLKRHMSGEETPPAAQIRAAQIFLEQALQIHKMSELEQKYEELERLVKDQAR